MCADRFEKPLCAPCLVSYNGNIAKQLYYGLALTVAILITVTYLVHTQGALSVGQSLLMGALAAGTYWGWRFLSDHAPRLTMGSMLVWILYLSLKFIAAYFIGLLVGPYQVFKMMRELNRIQGVKRRLAGGQT